MLVVQLHPDINQWDVVFSRSIGKELFVVSNANQHRWIDTSSWMKTSFDRMANEFFSVSFSLTVEMQSLCSGTKNIFMRFHSVFSSLQNLNGAFPWRILLTAREYFVNKIKYDRSWGRAGKKVNVQRKNVDNLNIKSNGKKYKDKWSTCKFSTHFT